MENHPMSYDLHKPVSDEELETRLCHGWELKRKLAEARKQASEEYDTGNWQAF